MNVSDHSGEQGKQEIGLDMVVLFVVQKRHSPLYRSSKCIRTCSAGVEWFHIEDIDALHFTKNLQSLQARTLIFIRRHFTRLGTGWEQVFL